MESLGLPNDGIWKQIIALCAIVAIIHCTSFLVLHFKHLKQHVRQLERTTEKEPSTRELNGHSTPSGHGAQISLQEYSLKLRKSSLVLRWRAGSKRPIVGPVSSAFQAGCLSVVMGASGSGKTSLLASLAGRLPTTFNSHWELTGAIICNGVQVEAHSLRSLVSYVPQDDYNLLPALTVRETLHFAAELELASSTTSAERGARVRSIIAKFGLDDCADTVVGSALTRGISGGEKRRLSIACKMLTFPQIIVLDEPTSGLDTFVASSIIHFLHHLSVEGCTIILSIHQPTSSMWSLFSTCLLLTPKGLPVFSGKVSEMIPYFSRVGYACPSTMNPADFFIDTATPHFVRGEGNSIEEERVELLVSQWAGYRSSLPTLTHSNECSDNLEYNFVPQKPRMQCSFLPPLAYSFAVVS
jgi:ABC-type multidrug transport system ATPase subunit